MTDTQTGTLVSVKTVTAENIVAALGIERTEATVKAVEQHIGDEMAAIQSHFSLAVADIQNTYATELNKARVVFSQALDDARGAVAYVKTNKKFVIGVLGAVFVIGVLVGQFV